MLAADTCGGRRICCSKDITASSHRICESQGQARYTRSAKARDVAMCQSHSQNPYRRSARTRIIVTVNMMPNPFFVRALGAQAKSYQKKMGAGATSFHLTLSSVITHWLFSTRTKREQ